MENVIESDVVVVGAGNAGAAAALCLAEAGLAVRVVEAGPLSLAGARWSDDLPPWLFDRARISRPEPPERRNRDVPYVLFGAGDSRVELPASPMWAVDVPRLVARLRDLASARGATFQDRTTVTGVRCDADGRPIAIEAQDARGGRAVAVELRAPLFVDASGVGGVLRRHVAAFGPARGGPAPTDLCSAAQFVCDVGDRAGARAFLDGLRAQPGTFLAWAGVRGGFSTRVIHTDPGLDHVAVLTGLTWDGATHGAVGMMDELRREQPWIGSPCLGGHGLIPLRRQYDRLAAPGIALVGDAACQVFPPTGCGIGSALVAARMLGDAVAGRTDPGSLEATWAYQAAFQRERGGVHAAYDLFRRMTQSLSGAESSDLVRAGLVTAGSLRSVLEQGMLALGPADVARTLAGAARRPRLAARMAKILPRMLAVRAAHALYPATPDVDALRTWSRRTAALAGGVPDLD